MPQLAEGVHLLPPGCTEDFFSFSPALARGRGGLYSFSPALARGRGGLLFSRLHSLEGEEVFSRRWCLRSPKDDEDFKTLADAANRRKAMETSKLLLRKHAA